MEKSTILNAMPFVAISIIVFMAPVIAIIWDKFDGYYKRSLDIYTDVHPDSLLRRKDYLASMKKYFHAALILLLISLLLNLAQFLAHANPL